MFKTIFVVIIGGATLLHFLKNAKRYSTKNKLVLPIIYATSLVLLWHVSPLFFVFTTVKVVFFGDHVSQTKFNYYGTKNAPLYIVAHDVLAFLGALVASRL